MDRHRDRGDYSDDIVSNHHHPQDNNTSNSPGDYFHRRHPHPYPYPYPSHNNQLHDSSTAPFWEDTHHSIPYSGRKRPFSHLTQDLDDAVSVVKLYVAGVPKTATEEDIRSVFGEHGNVVEVVLLRDKRTGQQQESCFVKYASFEEANVAIGTLNGLYPFSGILYPIKVKYADGERERLEKKGMLQNVCSPTTVASASQKNYGRSGEHTLKLYVGCVNRQASKEEIEEIFLPYGDVEDVFIVRDEMRQQRGCAFVRFSCREMAVAAINALHGIYIMRGCEQPLIVRFADPKKPRGADSRAPPCNRDRMGGHIWPNDFHQPADTGNKPNSESFLPSSSSSCAAVSTSADGPVYIDCDWSEHICPDGDPYYYNCVTCESRWEKPEEYTVYERELLKLEQQQHISQSRVLSSIEGAA